MADIGAKLKVDGESSFSKAMRDAAKNTRSLNSELKLAEAQFKASGDAQKLYTDKGKILREQLQEQERAVQAATSMLETLGKSGYDANSTKVMEWRAKLAQAKQGVLEISQAIQENDAALQQSAEGYDTLGESLQNAASDARTAQEELGKTNTDAVGLREALEKIGITLGWEGIHNALHSVNQKIDATIRKCAQMAKALWDAGVDATVWADNLQTLSDETGYDRKTLQQWEYASRFVDTTVDSIISSRKKLLSNMKSTSKETALSFNELGVVTRKADGSLRDVNDVFWESIEALGRIDDQTQRDAMAMNIFGKSASELNPLIKAGRKEWEEYANAAPIIEDKKIDALTSANDAIEDMNAQLEALKLDVLSEMAPTIEQVASAIASAAKALKDFLDTDEGQAALTRLQGAISGLLEDFTEQDFGKILTDAAGNVTSLIDGFSKFIEQKDAIVKACEIIAGGIVGLKVAEAVTAVGNLITKLKLLKSFSIIAGGAGAADAGAQTVTETVAKTSPGWLTSLKNGLSAFLPQAGFLSAFLGGTVAVSKKIDEAFTQSLNERSAKAEEMAQKAEEAEGTVSELADTLRIFNDVYTEEDGAIERLSELTPTDIDTLRKITPKNPFIQKIDEYGSLEDYFNSGEPVAPQMWYAAEQMIDELSDYINNSGDTLAEEAASAAGEVVTSEMEAAAEAAEELTKSGAATGMTEDAAAQAQEVITLTEEQAAAAQKYWDIVRNGATAQEEMFAYQDLFDAFADSAEDLDTLDALMELIDSLPTSLEQLPVASEAAGENVSIGLMNGINAQADSAIAAAAALASAVADTIASALLIASPSKLMERYGEYVGEGFALGIEGSAATVARASEAVLGGLALRAPAISTPAAHQASGSEGGMAGLILSALSQMRVQIDGHDAGQIMLPTLEELMAEQTISRRYDA